MTGGPSPSGMPRTAAQGRARPKMYPRERRPEVGARPGHHGGVATSSRAPIPALVRPAERQQQQWGQYRAPSNQMPWGQLGAPGGRVRWGQSAAPASNMKWGQRDSCAPGGLRQHPSGRSGAPWTPPRNPRSNPPHVVWCGPARPPSWRGGPTPSMSAPSAFPIYYVPEGLELAAPCYYPTPLGNVRIERGLRKA